MMWSITQFLCKVWAYCFRQWCIEFACYYCTSAWLFSSCWHSQGRFLLQQFGVASGVARSVFGGQEFRMT